MKTILLFTLLVGIYPAMAQSVGDLGVDRIVSTSDGIKLHCLEKGTGPALLFVPGWTMPAEIWEQQIKHFSAHYHVVAMDPRCQGQSSQTTNGLNSAARARDIKAVVDACKLEPVVLVGWSMGVGEVAAYVDQFGSKTLSAVVLVDGVAGMDLPAGMAPEDISFLKSLKKDPQAFTEKFVRGMYQQPQSDAYLKRIITASSHTPPDAATALMVAACKNDERPALKKIDRPTLIVVSSIPKVTWSVMQSSIAGSRVEVFEKSGHALFVDEADKFNSVLDDFLKQNQKNP